MEYPIYIRNRLCGRLRVYTEGLITYFEAECEPESGLIKLRVFGESGSAYLGTLQPGKSGLFLKRRYTRSELKTLPDKIEYAADSVLKKSIETENAEWRRSPTGILYYNDGESSLVALPLCDSAQVPEGMSILVGGRKYIVFPGKRNSGIYHSTMV